MAQLLQQGAMQALQPALVLWGHVPGSLMHAQPRACLHAGTARQQQQHQTAHTALWGPALPA